MRQPNPNREEIVRLCLLSKQGKLFHENDPTKRMTYKDIGEKFGLTKNAVVYILSRYLKSHPELVIEENTTEIEPKVKVVEGEEERKPKFKDLGDHYIIFAKNQFGKTREITLTKEKLKQIKDCYCSEKLTINQICYRLDITRRDFIVIKNAFSITHDDVPFIDEEVMNGNIDELVDRSIEKKKEQYFLRLQAKEIEDMKNELNKYREKDYFYNKVIKEMNVPITPLTFDIKNIDSVTEAQLNFADWHTGLKVENYWNAYSLEIQRQRLQDLVSKTISYIKRHNVKKLHVMNLGDILHGVIHTSTRIVAEVDVIQQFRISWQLISNILETLAAKVEVLYFYSTYGNHSRVTEKKTDALDRENFE